MPRDLSTKRVRISRIALDRALMSIAQMPRITGGFAESVTAEMSEWEPLGEGEDDLVEVATIDWERGDLSGE